MPWPENFRTRMHAMRNTTGRQKYADKVFIKGQVVNVDAGRIERADVAVSGSRISRVGSVSDLMGPNTRVIEIGGNTSFIYTDVIRKSENAGVFYRFKLH